MSAWTAKSEAFEVGDDSDVDDVGVWWCARRGRRGNADARAGWLLSNLVWLEETPFDEDESMRELQHAQGKL